MLIIQCTYYCYISNFEYSLTSHDNFTRLNLKIIYYDGFFIYIHTSNFTGGILIWWLIIIRSSTVFVKTVNLIRKFSLSSWLMFGSPEILDFRNLVFEKPPFEDLTSLPDIHQVTKKSICSFSTRPNYLRSFNQYPTTVKICLEISVFKKMSVKSKVIFLDCSSAAQLILSYSDSVSIWSYVTRFYKTHTGHRLWPIICFHKKHFKISVKLVILLGLNINLKFNRVQQSC